MVKLTMTAALTALATIPVRKQPLR